MEKSFVRKALVAWNSPSKILHLEKKQKQKNSKKIFFGRFFGEFEKYLAYSGENVFLRNMLA